jgi:hypothetical protein
MTRDFFEHQTTGTKCDGLRLERGYASRDEVCIHENRAAGLVGQKFTSKGRFPRTIGAGDDDDFLLVAHG